MRFWRRRRNSEKAEESVMRSLALKNLPRGEATSADRAIDLSHLGVSCSPALTAGDF